MPCKRAPQHLELYSGNSLCASIWCQYKIVQVGIIRKEMYDFATLLCVCFLCTFAGCALLLLSERVYMCQVAPKSCGHVAWEARDR